MCKIFYALGVWVLLAGYISANELSPIVSSLPNSLIKEDLKYKTDEFLKRLRKDDLSRKEYIDRLYSFEALEVKAKEEGLLENSQVIAELKVAREDVLIKALLREELIKLESDIEALAKERYQVDKERYKTRRRIRLAQIFIKKGSDVTSAKEKAEKILEDLRSKISEVNFALYFANQAREHSDDKHSGSGGEFGKWLVEPDPLDESKKEKLHPVVKAAFELTKPDQVSGLIESNIGFHILRLTASQPARQQNFEEVKETIMQDIGKELLQSKREELLASLLPPEEVTINDEAFLSLLKEVLDGKQ